MSRMSPGNPLQHIVKRQLGDLHNIQGKLYDERLNVAKNLFRKDLFCHYGCVNAIEFSKNGEYLVSGGDDRRVILWKFGEALLDHGEPQQMVSQHLSNIFCLTLTPDISHIYSGGNDYQVIVHDTQTKRVVELLPHQKAVSGLSLDPTNSKILATAGNDGRLLLFDTRQSVEESLVVSRSRKPYHGVVFHPTQEGLIAAANAVNGATLWDLRKTKVPVMRYGEGLAHLENCMSVCFDTLGTRILALRRRLPPVLYAVDKPEAVANFYHPDYYNSCTMKSCCFAGDRDQYVVSGSDDFNLYMWKVPEKEKTWVDQTHMVLSGHRSIVNQVRYNSKYCIVASSGVEKIIKTWSPLEVPGSRGALLDEHVGNDNPRTVYSHEEYVSLVYYSGQYISHNYSDQSTMEDPRMMAFFDSLVQREIEGWSADDTDSHSVSDGSGGAHGVTTRRQAASMNTSLQSGRHKDTEDSSDSDQLLVDFLPLPPKRTTNGVRSQRCLRMATRQSKLARLAQKRLDSRRKQKSTVTSARIRTSRTLTRRAVAAAGGASGNNSSLHHHASRRRDIPGSSGGVMGAGSSSVTANISSHILRHQMASHSSSEGEESDTPPQQRPHQRHTSKMTRSNRRRMTMSRNYDRKNKSNISNIYYRGKGKGTMRKGSCNFSKGLNMNSNNSCSSSSHSSTLAESAYTEDNLAVPSTSTGIRGTNNTPLFRINEADSDDDQSGASHSSLPNDSLELPLVSIIPTPINGIHSNANVNINPADSYNNGAETPLSRYENLEEWTVNNRQPSSTLARLRNETNESEMESSCSTGSPMEDVTISPPKKRVANEMATTPDSGILTAPSSSSGQRPASRDNDLSDEPDWVIAKHRQRVKRARRNYRTHIGDSDST